VDEISCLSGNDCPGGGLAAVDAWLTGLPTRTAAPVVQTRRASPLRDPRPEGRSVFYLPTCSRDESVARLMHEALDSSHDKAASILHFVQEMPEDGLAMLRNYLEQT